MAERSSAIDRHSYSSLFQLSDNETRYRRLEVSGIDFDELDMEAVRRIQVDEFPAFLIADNQGETFLLKSFEQSMTRRAQVQLTPTCHS